MAGLGSTPGHQLTPQAQQQTVKPADENKSNLIQAAFLDGHAHYYLTRGSRGITRQDGVKALTGLSRGLTRHIQLCDS